MAIISTIRNRFGWLLLIFMALVLILFVIDSGSKNISQIFGGKNQSVGEIDGQSISYEDFQKEAAEMENQYIMQIQQMGRTSLNDQERTMIREQAWNQLIQKIAYQKEFDKLGLTVTEDELVDLVQGNNIDPSLKQSFTNPQTGQFDKAGIINYLQRLKSDSLPENVKNQWLKFEAELPVRRMQTKYNNLLQLSTYVTKAEAQQEYQSQATKADVKFLYVPYFSIPDTTIKVTDDQLKEYYAKNKAKYKTKEARTIQYVALSVLPTKEDTSFFYKDIVSLAKGLAVTKEDSLFAKNNSDVPVPYGFTPAYQLPQYIQDTLKYLNKGGIYGPFREGGVFSIYKLVDVKSDSIPSTKASHILFKFDAADTSALTKSEIYAKAQNVLKDIKSGKITFEQAALQYGQDGTSQKGGDLGWIAKNGQMLKPFENAIFGASKVGLLDKIVETQYGYHIIKITEPQTRVKYKFASIQKNIAPSSATRESVYQKASQLAGVSDDLESFKEAVKKDPALTILTADKVDPNSDNLNTLQNAREIVRWSNDAKVGEVSKQIFELENQFVVAALTGKTTSDDDNWENFKNEITFEVRKQIKGDQITAKLTGKTGSLDDIATNYGTQAQINSAQDVSLSNPSLSSIGFDPAAVGKVFGLKEGQRSKPFAGENGVIIIELIKLNQAPEIADFGQYKNQLKQSSSSRTSYLINEAIKDNSKIKDERYKFY